MLNLNRDLTELNADELARLKKVPAIGSFVAMYLLGNHETCLKQGYRYYQDLAADHTRIVITSPGRGPMFNEVVQTTERRNDGL